MAAEAPPAAEPGSPVDPRTEEHGSADEPVAPAKKTARKRTTKTTKAAETAEAAQAGAVRPASGPARSPPPRRQRRSREDSARVDAAAVEPLPDEVIPADTTPTEPIEVDADRGARPRPAVTDRRTTAEPEASGPMRPPGPGGGSGRDPAGSRRRAASR